jgi:hypothetical protein
MRIKWRRGRARQTRAPCTQNASDSPAEGVSLMPFIQVGTFLVAAHWGLARGLTAIEPPPSLNARTTRLR